MATTAHLRVKAVQLRVDKKMPMDEIAKRLSIPRSTVYSWIKDIPIERTSLQTRAQKQATQANVKKWKQIRAEAYQSAEASAKTDLENYLNRDFTVLYIAEGYKRNRTQVSICNSSPQVMKLANTFLTQYHPSTKMGYWVHYYPDQNPLEVQKYWGEILHIEPSSIKLVAKTNSGELKGRNWNSPNGIITIRVGDVRLRSKIQAWIDYLQDQWEIADTV